MGVPEADNKNPPASSGAAEAIAQSKSDPDPEELAPSRTSDLTPQRSRFPGSFRSNDDYTCVEAAPEPFLTVKNVRHTARTVLKAAGLGYAFPRIGCDCANCY